jgi:hypothetical protein
MQNSNFTEGNRKTRMRAHRSKLRPIKDAIRDLQLRSNVVVYDGMVGVLSAISGNVLYEKQTKLDVEEAIALRGAT